MMGTQPQNPDNFSTATKVAATQPNTPVAEICEPCAARFRVEAHYDDPWKTPITLAPLQVQYTDGALISEGGRTRALATFGLQDGEPIQGVLPEVGAYDDRAPEPGAITARLVPEDVGDPAALEEQIISDLATLAQTMETAMQPWISDWKSDGWLGLFSSLWSNLKSGAAAWWEGEGDFWASVGKWLSNLPDMLGDAWESLSESAKALWENRDQILALLQDLAQGSVAAFETGLEALSNALQNIPGLEEISLLLKDLVEESAEWAGAMIEMATQTRVLAVLGATMLGSMMMIPPNFWTDMISFGVGYLIPELFIAAVLAIIAFFTAGTGGAALAARIATYTGKVTTALSKAGRAGQALLRVFTFLKSISGKMIDLIKALKGKIDEVAEGVTNGITRITRRSGKRVRAPTDMPCFNRPPNSTRQEFVDQLTEQEAAINNSDLSELMRRRALVKANGTGKFRDAAAQRNARSQWIRNKIDELIDQHGLIEAERLAELEASTLDATHVLDIVAGGDPSNISGLQNRSVNRSLGSQWRGKVDDLDRALADQARQGAVKANIRLRPC
ncbi:hypothetical protein HGF13_06460 [Rhodobacteraceae bacterium R_SAG5]|nr:hypothetical protein [Rhodobacteraceae bacterium R_SAG5]